MDEKIKNAKSTLKIMGILSIIMSGFGIILGAMSIGGGGILAGQMAASGGMSSTEADAAATMTGLVLAAGIMILVSGIFALLLGIFSVRASNDFSKVGPAYVLAIIDLIVSIISVIVNFAGTMNVSSLLDGVVGVVFAACIFWAAKTIRDNA
jgi:heme/copper-type cytochrome/quinol oxidase subunit 2